MNKFATLTATVAFAAFGFTLPAVADDMPMTGSLACTLVGDTYLVEWEAIESDDLEKYTASIECSDPDDEDIETGEYDASTADCFDEETGEGVMGVECDGPLATSIMVDAALIVDEFGENPAAGDICIAKLRGLHSGPGKGRQNNPKHAAAVIGCDAP
jgi:hypothetical protein